MKSSRLAAVAALSSVLLVSACSGSEGDGSSSSEDASASQSSGGGGGQDDAQSSGADDDTVTAEAEGVASVDTDEAEAIAADLLTKAAKVSNGDGNEITSDAKAAYRGHAYYAALAADQLEEIEGEPPVRDLITDPVEPTVLAISRDDGEFPLLMLVQTVPESGPPELYVMASPDEPENFRIVWWAPMLPGTDIGTFDRRTVGSPILREGAGDLARSPQKVYAALADSIDYPVGEPFKAKTNGYAPAVREAAAEQADEVSEQAELTESNELRTRMYTFYREDGSAVSFAALKRETEFDVRDGMELTPPESFLVFNDDEAITGRARLNTYVYMALALPQDDSRPEMVAVREQLVSAVGS